MAKNRPYPDLDTALFVGSVDGLDLETLLVMMSKSSTVHPIPI
jgi:hypothetical protein